MSANNSNPNKPKQGFQNLLGNSPIFKRILQSSLFLPIFAFSNLNCFGMKNNNIDQSEFKNQNDQQQQQFALNVNISGNSSRLKQDQNGKEIKSIMQQNEPLTKVDMSQKNVDFQKDVSKGILAATVAKIVMVPVDAMILKYNTANPFNYFNASFLRKVSMRRRIIRDQYKIQFKYAITKFIPFNALIIALKDSVQYQLYSKYGNDSQQISDKDLAYIQSQRKSQQNYVQQQQKNKEKNHQFEVNTIGHHILEILELQKKQNKSHLIELNNVSHPLNNLEYCPKQSINEKLKQQQKQQQQKFSDDFQQTCNLHNMYQKYYAERDQEQLKQYIISLQDKQQNCKQFLINFLSGGLAGVGGYLIRHPIEVFQVVKIENQTLKKAKKTNLQLLKYHTKKYGVSGLYACGLSTFMGAFFYYGLVFGIYDTCKSQFFQNFKQTGFLMQYQVAFFSCCLSDYLTLFLAKIRYRQLLFGFEQRNQQILTMREAYFGLMESFGRKTISGKITFSKSLSPALMLVLYDKMHPTQH